MNSFDPEDPYENISGFAYALNSPTSHIDPDGRLPILIPIIAGLVGGGLNVASNWSKIKDPWQGLGYFATGAAGGVVSLGNPLAGGAITSGGNAAIDIATGNLPSFNDPTDALLYVGKEAATGAFTSFAGAQAGKIIGPALSKLGNSVGGWFKHGFQTYAQESLQTVLINGKPITTSIEVGIKATKQYVSKALGSTVARNAVSKNTLVHYTNEKGYNSIMKSGELLPSIGVKNARYGTGQYLTDISQNEVISGQASRRLFGVPWNQSKLTHYVEIDVNGLNVIKNSTNNFLIPNSGSLNIGRRIVNGGTTSFLK